jgi:hypothetical protein
MGAAGSAKTKRWQTLSAEGRIWECGAGLFALRLGAKMRRKQNKRLAWCPGAHFAAKP